MKLPLQKSCDGKRILDDTESLVANCEIIGSNFPVDYSHVETLIKSVNEHAALCAVAEAAEIVSKGLDKDSFYTHGDYYRQALQATLNQALAKLRNPPQFSNGLAFNLYS